MMPVKFVLENPAFILAYAIGVNLFTFFLFGTDKKLAKEHRYRIPEKVLIILTLMGGGVGAMIGMYFFHHKTKKPTFYIGIPVIMCAQVLILFNAAGGPNW